MVHSSGEERTDIFNWALNVFLVKVLEQHGSRWAVFGVALSVVVALPNVDGKTHRTDLPDNGFRFLPLDAEKVIPSSIPFGDRAIELEGNAPALTRSFIALWTILPIVVISLAFLSWARRRKDQELYERVLETYNSQKEMLDRTERMHAELCEKNTGIQEWNSVQFPPEGQPGQDPNPTPPDQQTSVQKWQYPSIHIRKIRLDQPS
ncbi:hypothetical protein PtA15_7A53 [Puccinia triticina]|uniref:Uncharacterized protein n=1 Tax=Puccinia triticina TaxID=208348 RepID=A0ABY7CQR8_9BASI|nr:uncharacterized protein PtA15_7A53 [Puccinia triticina]WAQ86327.1 hypothetical protein PtA15_7A53 [Puccinia triticina]